MNPGNKTEALPHSTLNASLILSRCVANTTDQHQSKQFKFSLGDQTCGILEWNDGAEPCTTLLHPAPTPQLTHQLLVLEWILWCSSRLRVVTMATSKYIFFRTISPCFTEAVGDGDKKTKSNMNRRAGEARAAKQRNGQESTWWVRRGWRKNGIREILPPSWALKLEDLVWCLSLVVIHELLS